MSYESCKPPFSTPNLTETGPNFFFGVKNRFFFRRKRNGFCPRRAGAPRRDSVPYAFRKAKNRCPK